jgi:Zn-dependent membrane protease YugP
MVLFSILTLPVELDASRRGIRLLQEAGLLNDPQDAQGAKQMLNAAALTYLAAAITSILQLLYYVSIAQRRS